MLKEKGIMKFREAIVEIDAALDIANDLKYLDNIELNQLEESMIRTFKLLSGLISQRTPH
ncbi:MAG: hypothetical protein ABI184_05805 [Ginsengibacter sp.]